LHGGGQRFILPVSSLFTGVIVTGHVRHDVTSAHVAQSFKHEVHEFPLQKYPPNGLTHAELTALQAKQPTMHF
jgi:hypothetical protein